MSASLVMRRLVARDVEDYRANAFGSVHHLEASKPIEAHVERLKSSLVLGASENGKVIGVIGLKQEDGPKEAHKGFVWGFYVEPDYRKRGVGAALISAVLTASRRIVEQVTLSVVADNTAAITLYERFGFVPYGLEPRALKTQDGYSDELLMVLFLDASVLSFEGDASAKDDKRG